MPTYTYHCDTCGVTFEKVQKFTDKALTRCPECRKGSVRRVLQPPAIVFKGSGWYKTDHRSSGGTGTSSDGKKSKAKTESSPAAAESAPAKTEPKPAPQSDD